MKIKVEGTKKEIRRFKENISEICPFGDLKPGYCPRDDISSVDYDEVCSCPLIEYTEIRWRAECGERYYWIQGKGVVAETFDGRSFADNTLYALGNYYKTEKQAEAAAQRVRKAYLD